MDEQLLEALRLNKTVLTGVGKSYIVAQLGASLLQSVGCNATAIHATDMLHGGLNIKPDVIITISHSGETAETLAVMDFICDAVSVAITGGLDSQLSFASSKTLHYDIERDGSKHGTIPANSVLEQVKILNEIVCALADEMTKEELAAGHPGGSLGKVYTWTD